MAKRALEIVGVLGFERQFDAVIGAYSGSAEDAGSGLYIDARRERRGETVL
jgi:hypothetical protein